jgi:hypothetical protein
MLRGFCLLASLFALSTGLSSQDSYVQSEPKGWRCEYRINEGQSDGPTIYNCYGASLHNTRARTKYRCVVNALCNAGACLPLDFAPARSCQK